MGDDSFRVVTRTSTNRGTHSLEEVLGRFPSSTTPVLKIRSGRNLHRLLCMTPARSKLIGTALRRGWRKRCPHCGEGPLFSGWSQFERCSICGLVFTRNPGDTWAFTIIGDRLPISVMIVLIYFGVVRSHPVLGLTMVVVLLALLVWTAPNRWGAGISLHYLSRVYWPDSADPIPPPPANCQAPTGVSPPPGSYG